MSPWVGNFKIGIVFMESTSNSGNKSLITFFSKTAPFSLDHFEFYDYYAATKGSNLQNGLQKFLDMNLVK
jgi:hypothetical protein